MNEEIFEIPIVIPAYEPDEKLINLVHDLREAGFKNIVITNDGSKASCDEIFETLEKIYDCTVLHHNVNQGKGRALKTAFNHCLLNYPDSVGCITADADGQHSPDCIRDVALAMTEHPGELILGVRCFDEENVPLKSELGNKITRKVMKFLTGVSVSDTQTGLRGIPQAFMKELMSVKGERYEFEMNMLLETRQRHIKITEIPIETIYIDENRSSHFNPFKDSLRIYMMFGKFVFSSMSASVIDMTVFILLCNFLREADITHLSFLSRFSYITLSTVGARFISGLFNYIINSRIVFQTDEKVVKTLPKYIVLAVTQMCLSAFLVGRIHSLTGGAEILVKIPVDLCLFLISYFVQREIVYK